MIPGFRAAMTRRPAAAATAADIWPATMPTPWFDFDPGHAASVTLNGTAIQAVADKAGSGRSVAQAAAASQPGGNQALNGYATALFDGSNDILASTDIGAGGDELHANDGGTNRIVLTVFMLTRKIVSGTGATRVYAALRRSGETSTTAQGCEFGQDSGGGCRTAIRDSAFTGTISATPATGAWFLLFGRIGFATLRSRVDGGTESSASHARTVNTLRQLSFGASVAMGNAGFQANIEIARAGIFAGDQSAHLPDVRAGINTRYGLSL